MTLVFGYAGAQLYRFLRIQTIKIDDRFYVLLGGGGNTAVLIGDDSVLIAFGKRHIVHTGDLFLHEMYPFIDLRGGGSVRAWPATLDRVLAMGEVSQYIPGHGPLSTRADVLRFQGYLRSLLTQVEPLVARGASLAAVQAAVDLHEYDDFTGTPFFTSRAKNIESVYRELTAK